MQQPSLEARGLFSQYPGWKEGFAQGEESFKVQFAVSSTQFDAKNNQQQPQTPKSSSAPVPGDPEGSWLS